MEKPRLSAFFWFLINSLNEILMRKNFIYAILIFLTVSCARNTRLQEPYSFEKWKEAKLVWSDEFDGTEVDTAKWVFQTGDHGWGNNELQDYRPFDSGNTVVEKGKLSITAKLVGEGQNVGDYTSARLNSKAFFKYGRMEIRAKMPDYVGAGLWPAIWMLGEAFRKGRGWPESGEIDIMEYLSHQPDSVLVTIHTKANNHMNGTQIGSGPIALPTTEEAFHNYGILWEEEVLHFYIDEIENIVLTFERPENYTNDNWPFDKPFYLLINIAIGGNLGGIKGVDDGIFPATMDIDYVRVWQIDTQ